MNRTANQTVYFIHNNFKMIIITISIILLIGIILFGGFSKNRSVSANPSHEKYFVCIDVEEGDTLWTIADTYITEEYASVDEYVDEVKSINQLNNDKIYDGATLIVPYYAP